MSTPTPSANPVAASWDQALASRTSLLPLYAIGFGLTVALSFAMSHLLTGFSFVFGLEPATLVWIPVIIVIGLLMAWYRVHLLLAIARHRAHQALPTPMESLRRVPQLLIAGILAVGFVAGPLIVLMVASALLSLGVGAQEALPMQELMLEQTGSSGARLGALFQGGLGLLAMIAGLVWAVYASLRISQASPLVIVDSQKGLAALKQSWAMTPGRLWYIFSWGIVLAICFFLLGIVAGVIDSFLAALLPVFVSLGLASGLLTGFLITPWTSFFTLEIFDYVKHKAAESTPNPSNNV